MNNYSTLAQLLRDATRAVRRGDHYLALDYISQANKTIAEHPIRLSKAEALISRLVKELDKQSPDIISKFRASPNYVKASGAASNLAAHSKHHTVDSVLDIQARSQTSTIGIALFCFTRHMAIKNTLESLHLQGAEDLIHVFIDGDQGNPEKKMALEKTYDIVDQYNVKAVHSRRGNYGFRRVIIESLIFMARKYDYIIVLEDDCFPTRDAIPTFIREIDGFKKHSNLFSVYGHPFKIENEHLGTHRFQGWGWMSSSEKLFPFLLELLRLYSLPESHYLDFVTRELDEALLKRIDVTPPRNPSHTLTKFYAWDETLCLLTAKQGLVHKPTRKRCIFNCGLSADSSHFRDFDFYRKPPFNMIALDEVWDYFDGAFD